MKAISEMTLEELQDYAREQQSKVAALEEEKKNQTTELDDLRATNLMLQNRNNALFKQVEQQHSTPTPEEQSPAEEPAESCEDFAMKNIKEILKR